MSVNGRPARAGRVESHVRCVHRDGRARLAGQQPHDAQYRAWDVMNLPGVAPDLLEERGELVERQVLRSSDLEDLTAQGRIEDGPFDNGGNVADGHEVDRVVAPAEHDGLLP